MIKKIPTKLVVKSCKTKKNLNSHKGYNYSEAELEMPAHDTDVALIMPNGHRIIVQFRVESPSIDICLPENLPVSNWEGLDMKPAPKAFSGADHIRKVDQLCIGLPLKFLTKNPERLFIVQPSPLFPQDSFYIVNRTYSKGDLIDIYSMNDYETIGKYVTLRSAKKKVTELGFKDVEMI
jgi:hypothetical protein